tara:strand:- start:1213 stop:2154 length:942 start_codon:yes stop_codon:yes gene_type:complete
MNSNQNQKPIDAVILWVDGNDKNHQLKMAPFLENKEIRKTKKFQNRFSQVNEIKFTVNSLLKFAPYLRNIFIITDNQKPKFLKDQLLRKKYDKISVIDHKTIFDGYEQYLPTFNNRTIECLMFRIPNLAEHFIYLNDDFFLINKTQPEDFFIDGKPVLRGKWLNFDENKFFNKRKRKRIGHKTAQQLSAKIAGFSKYYNFKHTPHPLRKSTFEFFFKTHTDLILNHLQYKFRSNKQFLIQGVINHIEIKNKNCFLKKDLQLLYFRSYKKPYLWYRIKFLINNENNIFLGLQNLNSCPKKILSYLIKWLEKKTA